MATIVPSILRSDLYIAPMWRIAWSPNLKNTNANLGEGFRHAKQGSWTIPVEFPQMNATSYEWLLVNIVSSNVLVPLVNKSMTEQITFWLVDRTRLIAQYTISLSSLCKLIWRRWTHKMPIRYILSSVWVRLSILSPLSIIEYVGLYVPNSLVNTYTLSYYHHQIRSMNYDPLVMARSWDNGIRCMSFYILKDNVLWRHMTSPWWLEQSNVGGNKDSMKISNDKLITFFFISGSLSLHHGNWNLHGIWSWFT